MKTRTLLLLPAFIGAIAGVSLGRPAKATRTAPRTLAPRVPSFDNGDHMPQGAKATLDAEIVLDALERDGSGREALEFHIDVQEAAGPDVKTTYLATLADDTDHIAHSAKPQAHMAVPAGAKQSSPHHKTPGLAD